MSCHDRRQAIRNVVLGEPPPPGLEEHLEACLACRDVLASDRRLLEQLEAETEGLLSVEASPGFTARVTAQVLARGQSSAWARWWWIPATLAAAALLLGVSLVVRLPRAVPGQTPFETPTTARAKPVESPSTSDVASVVGQPTVPEAEAEVEAQAQAGSTTPSAAPEVEEPASARPRVAPEVLISARDSEALRRFVAARGKWSVTDEPVSVGVVGGLETTSADWEMPEPEGDVVRDWELDNWPMAPGD